MIATTLTQRLLAGWVAKRWVWLLLAVAVAAVCWPIARNLRFEQKLEAMFAPDDPLLVDLRQFQKLFGAQEVLLAAYTEAEGLSPATFPRLREITANLAAAVPGVRVQSLSNTPFGEQILDEGNTRAAALRSLLTGYLISADRQTVAVICLLPRREELLALQAKMPPPALAEDLTKLLKLTPSELRNTAVDRLRGVIGKYPNGTLAGEPVMLVDGFRSLEQDGLWLEWLSTGLILLVIFAFVRSWRWLILPLALVQLTLLATRAYLATAGFQLSMVSSMLSAMITIVGVATIMHLIVRYQSAVSDGETPSAALIFATRELFWPICGALATDVIGFGSLLLSRVGPVHDFGLMTALGSALVLPMGALLVPGIALWGKRINHDGMAAKSESTEMQNSHKSPAHGHHSGLTKGLAGLWLTIEKAPYRWLLGVLVLASGAVWCSTWLTVETDFTKNFRSDSELVRSYEFVESRLGGAGVWDLLVPLPENLTLAELSRVRELQQELQTITVPGELTDAAEPGLTKVLSLVDMLNAVSPVPLAGQTDNVFTRGGLAAALELLRLQMPDLYKTLTTVETRPGGNVRWLRIMLRSKERQSAQHKLAIISRVRELAEKHFGGDQTASSPAGRGQSAAMPPPVVTGFYVLLTHLVDSLLADQWVTFAVATGGIALLLIVSFRSLRLAVIAIVPNALSIYLMLGTLGLLGLRINMGTVMIAAVSMGLSVDSSIHYLVAYNRLRRRGLGVSRAILAVEQSTGQAMVLATLALVVGYSALTASQFVPTIYFGALSGLTMLGGMLGNLIVLPLLLRVTERG
ncbi:MAG: MMPL family transporter [Pirellulales bacterium]|nr:MMPL family transporter [Pirellulales bacterium]